MKRRLYILSAEDHGMYAEVVEAIFGRAGHEVLTAANGREAWTVLERNLEHFDLVITDHQMPEMNGQELVEKLRGHGFRGKIIVHAANLPPALVARYRGLSVDGIAHKGADTERLLTLAEGLFT